MKKLVILGAMLGFLASCGVDGAPATPPKPTSSTGVTISGDARIGVVGGN